MKWEKVKLGDVVDSCLGKMLDKNKNRGEYQPYLANLNVRWGSFVLDDLEMMKFEESENERYGLKYGDLVICEGGEPGRCAIWKNEIADMKIQKALHRVRSRQGVDIFYLYYWFLLADKTGELEQYFTGATIKHMPAQKLKEVVIPLPPLPVQQRIASILSSYDDLIENNKKQIKLLEEAAQRLYKEWFVDLRFPGHENVKIVDGVPEGWSFTKIKDIADTMSGGTPSRRHEEYYAMGELLWLKTKELNDGFIFDTEEKITEAGLKNSSAKMFEKDCIILAMYGATIGKLGISSSTMCCNQACCVLESKEKNFFEYLYFWLFNNREMLISRGRGSAQSNLSQELIRQIELCLPSDDVLMQFSNVAGEVLKNKEVLEKQISSLCEARDRLLPKLMSGEIEV